LFPLSAESPECKGRAGGVCVQMYKLRGGEKWPSENHTVLAASCASPPPLHREREYRAGYTSAMMRRKKRRASYMILEVRCDFITQRCI
jgi:hypothetical protein